MTAVSAHDGVATAPAEPNETVLAQAVLDRFASPTPVANAALIGLPAFLVGSISLALVLIGFVPQGLVGVPIAIIAVATGLGLFLATIFALRAGESAVACVFGIFSGFWLSYAALVLGVVHDWYGLTAVPAGSGADATTAALTATGANILAAQKVFVLAWIIIIGLLTIFSVRLPVSFTLLFALVTLALIFVYIGTVNANLNLLKVAGGIAFAFVAVGAYLFYDAMSAATGGKNMPLGPALVK